MIPLYHVELYTENFKRSRKSAYVNQGVMSEMQTVNEPDPGADLQDRPFWASPVVYHTDA
jgi:hypothetical protein